MCAPPRVTEEHVLLSFTIHQKQLKEMNKQLLKQAMSGRGDGGSADKRKCIEFPENDSLSFDADKFKALLYELQAQKSVYKLKKLQEDYSQVSNPKTSS